ncbi:Crp/Fnr family transcriptional regulator [Kaustia mangrovi]|uniref:Crp/Fnr family transcriptional regulator n=1 Tax=Kaustia mangrovi TaxID=2593653 RepID=A0A7S8C297_9HYPH|nr:Crp/Fnr family transcriptional regulator [Kaustia mangrovi]QPC42050.1 Crp/Fnr family transcriptional regulator [Kaustia mangrovi]
MKSQNRASAEAAVLEGGWLSRQPEWFVREALAHASVETFEAGEAIYRIGGPPGGIYGLVDGTLKVSTAPVHGAPRFIVFGIRGHWAGEGPYLTGEPRRAELRAVTRCTLMHLSLDAMNRITAQNAEAIRCFAGITVTHFDVLARIVDDLLIPRAAQRIASVLHRTVLLTSPTLPISQEELGGMANASRKQVNAALARFAEQGWIRHSYRSIEVCDSQALLAFAEKNRA